MGLHWKSATKATLCSPSVLSLWLIPIHIIHLIILSGKLFFNSKFNNEYTKGGTHRLVGTQVPSIRVEV